jgi:hypothetical protein
VTPETMYNPARGREKGGVGLRWLTRPFALKGFYGQFMQGSIKISARPCELDNGSNRGRERDLVGWAKAISGPQSTVDT